MTLSAPEEAWMDMILGRNLSSHIDNPALLDHIARVGNALWVRESTGSGTS
jgi:hypothetical protein